MSEAPALRDHARSRAVLVRAWDYAHLPAIPAARNSLSRVQRLLTGPLCGWPAERVEVLRNPARRGHLPDRLMDSFSGIADVALFCFVGHGQLHEDELCLALRDSPASGPRRTTLGVPFSDVRTALRECDAQTKIVILDCCFSGRAASAANSLGPRTADVIDKASGTGAFTMAASGAYRTAGFEPGPRSAPPQTYFTKYLVDALARDRLPAPTRSVRREAYRFVLARNSRRPVERPADTGMTDVPAETTAVPPGAATAPPPSGPPSTPADTSPGGLRLSRRALVLTAALGVAGAGSAVTVPLSLNGSSGSHGGRTSDAPPSHTPSHTPSPSHTASTRPTASSSSVLAGEETAQHILSEKVDTLLTAVQFSVDGAFVAVGDLSGGLVLRRIPDLNVVAALSEPDARTGVDNITGGLALSPDGKLLASVDDYATVTLWDVGSGKAAATLHGDARRKNTATA